MTQGSERINPFEIECNPQEKDVLKEGGEIISERGRKYKLTQLLIYL